MDPRRLKGGSQLSKMQLMTFGSLKDDAIVVQDGNYVSVYKKHYADFGRTIFTKVAIEGGFESIMREAQAYERLNGSNKLVGLQGTVVPKMLRVGFFLMGQRIALSTRYAGEPLVEEVMASRVVLTHEMIDQAEKDLAKIHERGVLHGDLENVYNLLVSQKGPHRIVFVDFGRCMLRAEEGEPLGEAFISKDAWEAWAADEQSILREKLQELMGLEPAATQGNSPVREVSESGRPCMENASVTIDGSEDPPNDSCDLDTDPPLARQDTEFGPSYSFC